MIKHNTRSRLNGDECDNTTESKHCMKYHIETER